MSEHGIRLDDCGDNLTVAEYSAWMRQEASTTYSQLHSGTVLVQPWTLKPKPLWRREDCAAKFGARDLVIQQRKARARGRIELAKVC